MCTNCSSSDSECESGLCSAQIEVVTHLPDQYAVKKFDKALLKYQNAIELREPYSLPWFRAVPNGILNYIPLSPLNDIIKPCLTVVQFEIYMICEVKIATENTVLLSIKVKVVLEVQSDNTTDILQLSRYLGILLSKRTAKRTDPEQLYKRKNQ